MLRLSCVVALLGILAVCAFAQDSGIVDDVDPDRRVIAVLDLDMSSGVPESYQRPLSDRLRQELFNTGSYTVVERNSMKEIMDEQGLQMSGCTSNECAIEVGRLLGVKWIIAGSLGKVGQTYTISLRMIDVETSEILKAESVDCPCSIDDVLTSTLRRAALAMADMSDKEYVAPDDFESDDEDYTKPTWKWWSRAARGDIVTTPELDRNYGFLALKAGGERYGIRGGWLRESGACVAIEVSAGETPKPALLAVTVSKRWFDFKGISYAPQIGIGYDFYNAGPVLRYNFFAFEFDLSQSTYIRLGVDHDDLLGRVKESSKNSDDEDDSHWSDWMIQFGWKF